MIELLEAELEEHTEVIDAKLKEIVRRQVRDPALRAMAERAIQSSGLKARSFLTRATCKLLDFPYERAQAIGLASELLMASAFVIDDYFDLADYRSKSTSIWKEYGLENAIITGEVLHTIATSELLVAGQIDARVPDAWLGISVDFSTVFLRMYSAEYENLRRESPASEERALALAYERTGRLVSLCVTAAGKLCCLDETRNAALQEYADAIGRAVQIRDDIIDLVGEPDVTGKPALGDLWYGRQNFLLCYAANCKDPDVRKLIERLWRIGEKRDNVSDDDLQILRTGPLIAHGVNRLNTEISKGLDSLAVWPENAGHTALRSFALALQWLPLAESTAWCPFYERH